MGRGHQCIGSGEVLVDHLAGRTVLGTERGEDLGTDRREPLLDPGEELTRFEIDGDPVTADRELELVSVPPLEEEPAEREFRSLPAVRPAS